MNRSYGGRYKPNTYNTDQFTALHRENTENTTMNRNQGRNKDRHVLI